MNDIEKRALRRWLVVQLVSVYRTRLNDDSSTEWGNGFLRGEELILTKLAMRFFSGLVVGDMIDEAEKEATY